MAINTHQPDGDVVIILLEGGSQVREETVHHTLAELRGLRIEGSNQGGEYRQPLRKVGCAEMQRLEH